MKVREAIKRLKERGWCLARTSGSHRQFKHPVTRQLVTITGKLSRDIPIGTLSRIKRKALY